MSVIYCDGGHNKVTGDVAYACVVDGNSDDLLSQFEELFSDLKTKEASLPVGRRLVLIADFDDVKTQQNNGAELLAMYAALVIALIPEKNITSTPLQYKTIRSDSKLMTDFWSKRLCPKKARNMDKEKVRIIHQVIELRKIFEARGGVIEKISGDDNLADLGYHR